MMYVLNIIFINYNIMGSLIVIYMFAPSETKGDDRPEIDAPKILRRNHKAWTRMLFYGVAML